MALLFSVLSFCVNAEVFIPGVTPSVWTDEEMVQLKANKISSTDSPVVYDYYDMPFCKRHAKSKGDGSVNIGESLSGNTVTNSPYELFMKKDQNCVPLCEKKFDRKELKKMRELIDDEYRAHWMIDNLPVVSQDDEDGEYVSRGYPIGHVSKMGGEKDAKKIHNIHNHVKISVEYSENADEFDGIRIVAFQVEPFSIKHSFSDEKNPTGTLTSCDTPSSVSDADESKVESKVQSQNVEGREQSIIFTYDIKWEKSDTAWANRYDIYLKTNPDDEIHYFSIVNSLMIVLFLSGVVAMIMLRTLHKDISSYNELQTLEEAQEESGWKLVHGDVFRPPANALLLSVLSGSGLQILIMVVLTMVCTLFGLAAPANRGSLLTTIVLLYVVMGSIAGYASSRMYKLMGGKLWKECTFLTATLYPCCMGVIFIIISMSMSYEGSTATMGFGTILAVLGLWFGVSTPLVFVGSYFGLKREKIEVPVRTTEIHRYIPEQVWYTHPLFAIALGGVLPFGAVVIEMFFIMSALWLHQFFYVFGFLFVVLIILIITCAEITIVLCYFQLCNEDYHWWWRSFLSAGSSALYLFLYSVWYFMYKLNITGFVSTMLYFSYMGMAIISFFLLTGSIGFLSCLWFVRKIYGAIKVD